jgi:hypothetical protein
VEVEEAGEGTRDNRDVRELLRSEQLRRKAIHAIHVPLTSGIMRIQMPLLLEVSLASLMKMDYSSFYSYGLQTMFSALSSITPETGCLVQSNRRTQLFITQPVRYLILSTFMYGFADNMCITLSFVILDCPFHVGRPLHLFAAVKNLYLSEEYVPRIVPALQELVWGPNHRKHRSARQLTNRPRASQVHSPR